MQTNFKDFKKKKRKLKPFIKVIIFLISLVVIFSILYEINFFSSTKNFFQNSYTNIKTNITKFLPHKKDTDSDAETSESPNNTDDSFLSIFKKRLPSQNIAFASSTLMPNGDLKIFLKNTKDNAGYIYVSTKDNVEEVWNTFASILIADPVKNLFGNNLSNLNYVDLRFKNKVFYKFNGLNSSSSASTTSTSSVTNGSTS
jgi:hypothetical protein